MFGRVTALTQCPEMIRLISRLDPGAMPPLRYPVADLAPNGPRLTVYDEQHAITYVRMLDAEADGTDWREVSQLVLRIDPERGPDRARRAFDGHLAQAKWAAGAGYKQLLQRGWRVRISEGMIQREFSCTRALRLRPDDLKYARPDLFVVLLGDAHLDLVGGGP